MRALCLVFLAVVAVAQQLPNQPLLTPNAPPETSAQSCATDEWATPAEKSCYRTTPRYDETMAYARRIAQAAPQQVRLETFGKTGEGRELVAVIVSRDGHFDPAALHRANRPVVLIQNAIHAGEMDGKDSCLALLRDMVITKTRANLLERAVVVIIPIYNADGHERFGPYNRINQNGPGQMGWRTQAKNLNLNRDYLKADAPETRAWLRLWNRWLPDFFVDDHVTDGADYQYDTTIFMDSGPDAVPAHAQWTTQSLYPYLKKSVDATGHLLAPYLDFLDPTDPTKGAGIGQDVPRFANGYVLLQNRPAMLVEMHMLKDYRTRVTGNYEVLRALLEVINRDADLLVKNNREADAAAIALGSTPGAQFPLKLAASGKTGPFDYRGYKFKREMSDVSGQVRVEYTKDPLNITIPRQVELKVTRWVSPPRAYIVPAQWTEVIDVLAAHGLKLHRTTRAWEGEVEVYRCDSPTWQQRPFEGRHLASWPKNEKPCRPVKEKAGFPANSVIVPLDQRAAKVAIHLLEPEAPDSFVTWGFFDTVFEQKEYGESYVLEKLARDMLAQDPKLRQEFEEKLETDKDFAASPHERLQFFYRRSPWWDKELGRYPVGRLASLDGVPVK
ncbi:MAG: M14 family metallopeptidase [Terriglobales bacterium]